MLQPYMRVYSNRAFVLDYRALPDSLATAIRGLAAPSEELEVVEARAALDSDIVDKVLKRR
jgi:hypothetical protein